MTRMKTGSFGALLALVVATVVIGAAIAPAIAFAGSEGRLSGAVTDESGKGLGGVEVTLFIVDQEAIDTTTTSRKGRFSFLVVDSTADFGIRLEKSGYAVIQERIDIQVGETIRKEWQMKVGSSEAAPMAGSAAEPTATSAAIEIYNEAATAYNAGDRATAIAKFNEALAIDESMAAAHKAIAEVYLAEQSYEEAVASSKRYLELAPDSAEAISLLYDALNSAGRAEEGAQLLDQLVETDPSPATAKRLFNMALESSKKGDLDGALAGFSRALQVDPSLAQGYLGLADTYLRMGKYDDALVQAAEAAERMPPDTIGVPLVQYQAYRRKGENAKAAEVFAIVTEKNPQRAAQVLFDEGRTYFEGNEMGEAMPLFSKVLEIDPSHPDATYMLGLCKLNQNEIAEAKPLLQRFIELAPDHPDAATAREMLGAL